MCGAITGTLAFGAMLMPSLLINFQVHQKIRIKDACVISPQRSEVFHKGIS
jgi:hypothetical protein